MHGENLRALRVRPHRQKRGHVRFQRSSLRALGQWHTKTDGIVEGVKLARPNQIFAGLKLMQKEAAHMRRFLSTSINPIDKKGRVSVPAHFRTVIADHKIDELYALRALDVAALNVGGVDRLERYEARIANEDPFFGAGDDLSYLIHGDGAFLKLDNEGRLAITDYVRSHTAIDKDVAFVGRGDFFQIWAPEKLKAYSDDVRARLLEKRRLGAEAQP